MNAPVPSEPTGANGSEPDTQAEATPNSAPKHSWWWQRQTIRQLRRAAAEPKDYTAARDQQANERLRLSDGESIDLAGLIFVEAFTPSTVARLQRTLSRPRWSSLRQRTDEDWETIFADRRSAAGSGGWHRLGVVRKPGAFIAGDGVHDAELPNEIDAVWLSLVFLAPSLTMLVATFTLSEDAGNLSGPLNVDMRTTASNVRISVRGLFGSMRSRIPWARPHPRKYGTSYTGYTLEKIKMDKGLDIVKKSEQACLHWLTGNFPGRFSADGQSAIPGIRLILTSEYEPFDQAAPPAFALAGIGRSFNLWTSPQLAGWKLDMDRQPGAAGGHLRVLAACRRTDMNHPNGSAGADADSKWRLTYEFDQSMASLIAMWASSCLVASYTHKMADFRDRAATPRRRRAVKEAKVLDRYLMRDGLDASTVVTDLAQIASDRRLWSRNIPNFIADLSAVPEQFREAAVRKSLIEEMMELLAAQAEQVVRDTASVTTNISASANLRQVISNTRLGRIVGVVTFVSLLVSIVALVVAIKSMPSH